MAQQIPILDRRDYDSGLALKQLPTETGITAPGPSFTAPSVAAPSTLPSTSGPFVDVPTTTTPTTTLPMPEGQAAAPEVPVPPPLPTEQQLAGGAPKGPRELELERMNRLKELAELADAHQVEITTPDGLGIKPLRPSVEQTRMVETERTKRQRVSRVTVCTLF